MANYATCQPSLLLNLFRSPCLDCESFERDSDGGSFAKAKEDRISSNSTYHEVAGAVEEALNELRRNLECRVPAMFLYIRIAVGVKVSLEEGNRSHFCLNIGALIDNADDFILDDLPIEVLFIAGQVIDDRWELQRFNQQLRKNSKSRTLAQSSKQSSVKANLAYWHAVRNRHDGSQSKFPSTGERINDETVGSIKERGCPNW